MARSLTGHDAPDPSLAGPIRNIVASAHKWGGNGTIPLFNKIKRVLLAKHPEVIAKAFGGDANKAAAWIKDNWMAMHGHDPTKWRGKGKTEAQQLATEVDEEPDSEFFTVELDDEQEYSDMFQEVPLEMFDSSDGAAELFLADAGELEERDGLLWWPICRTGEWARSPLGNGKSLRLTKRHFDEAIDAFDNKAWEHVTIPLTHDDRVDENTGYIQGLEIRDDPTRPGQHRLWGGHKFTEPEIEEKVRRKSIIGRSVLLAIGGHRDTETGKFWPTVLKHVALTNKPWLNGLNDGVIAASQDGAAPIFEPVDDESDGVLALAKRLVQALTPSVAVTSETGDGGPDEPPGKLDPSVSHRYVGRYGGKCALCGKAYNGANHHGGSKYVGTPDESDAGVVPMELEAIDDSDLALGWLGSTSRDSLDDGDFLVVYKDSKGNKVRKLPYKIHGKVDPRGWKAAWNVVNGGRGGADLSGSGTTVAALRKKLLRVKPKDVEVSSALAASYVILTKGGGNMGENENGNENGEEVRLSQEDFQRMVNEAATAAVETERGKWEEKTSQLEERLGQSEARLSQSEAESHRLRIDQQLGAYQEKGVPPAVLTKVRELMLAQRTDSGELKLSHTDDEGKETEVTLSVEDAIGQILDSIPDKLLEKGQKDLSLAHHQNGDGPPEGESPADVAKKKADALWEDMKSGQTAHID